MLSFTAATTAFTAAPTPGRLAVAAHPARATQPDMVLPPVLRGAALGGAVGGAAMGLFNTVTKPKVASVGEEPVTKADVLAAQKLWADSIASISKVYLENGDYVAA